jgi:hypothetical protein
MRDVFPGMSDFLGWMTREKPRSGCDIFPRCKEEFIFRLGNG